MSGPDRERLIEMITGCWKTQVIGQGVALGLIDALKAGPMSSRELANLSSASDDGVHRLLRALAVLGLVEQIGSEAFALTAMGGLLRRDAADSLSGMAGHWNDRLWNSFATIGQSVVTGEPCVVSGPEHFAESQADPVQSDIFNRAMAEGSLRVGRALAGAYDFARFRTVMDVGGGYGALLVGLLEAHPQLNGQICDLPVLAQAALAYLAEQGVGGRVDYRGGSFFDSVPAGADCILLKFILHDWNDARCLRILENCRAALGAAGTILIIERIVPEIVSAADEDVIRGDLVMMSVGGRERTLAEYGALLKQAGLALQHVVPIDGNFSALEARPA
jgi:hypothetical protein